MTSITPLENVMSVLVSFNFTSLNRALVDLLNSYPRHFFFSLGTLGWYCLKVHCLFVVNLSYFQIQVFMSQLQLGFCYQGTQC